VSTTYGSQGKTADRVMALMDSTTTNRESFYVTVSRAKHHLALYTANKVALSHWAEVSKAKENTSDYVSLAQVVEKEVVSVPGYDLIASSTVTQPVVTTITELPEPKHIVVTDEITQQETEAFEVRSPSSETDIKLSSKQKYLDLWQRYSQELTINDPVNLDIQIAQRALKDGQAQKDVALMLSAGSSMVRRIVQGQGKQQAILYVNQMMRKIISCQTRQKPCLYKLQQSWQMGME
jgi:hypothetical protein